MVRIGNLGVVITLVAVAAAIAVSTATSAFGHPEPFRGEASWNASFVAPQAAEGQALDAGPSARIALNAVRLRPGQLLAMGVNVQNPLGDAADLLLGIFLPDGQTLILFSRAGAVTFIGPLANLSALPAETVPGSSGLNNPGFLQVTLPAQGVPTGSYLVFALLLQHGALADNQLDPGEVLAVDTKTFTFSPSPPNGALPLLQSPFTGDAGLGNPFDHFFPTQFIDTNGIITHYWGEQFTSAPFPQLDPTKSLPTDLNHSGYDFLLPEGTPLFAAADGTVVFAGSPPPTFCPILNATITGPVIRIDHVAPNGKHFQTIYGHVSRVDVQTLQKVVAGQPIGLSGNTGCISGAAHLHFEVRLGTGVLTDPLGPVTDPYGWEGASPDPWAARPDGASSVWLWQDGKAPKIFRETAAPPNATGGTAKVTITTFRWMGANDAQDPNNEFVEITLDGRYVTTPTFDMTGFTLRNNRGDVFTFPPEFQMQVGRPVRVYTGPGVSTDTELFWGLGAGVWDNTRDCTRLVYPTGGSYFLGNASGACG